MDIYFFPSGGEISILSTRKIWHRKGKFSSASTLRHVVDTTALAKYVRKKIGNAYEEGKKIETNLDPGEIQWT